MIDNEVFKHLLGVWDKPDACSSVFDEIWEVLDSINGQLLDSEVLQTTAKTREELIDLVESQKFILFCEWVENRKTDEPGAFINWYRTALKRDCLDHLKKNRIECEELGDKDKGYEPENNERPNYAKLSEEENLAAHHLMNGESFRQIEQFLQAKGINPSRAWSIVHNTRQTLSRTYTNDL